MLDTGIPPTFIWWIWYFFNDRRAHVQLFNILSSSRLFTQGLSQGSVFAPLLFLFCINNLASSLIDDAIIALFPHNVSILTAARKKEDVKVSVQSVVKYMLIWSQEWKLNLKADKTEVYLFQLGLMAALANLPSILVLQKFGSTSLHVFSRSFWTGTLRSMQIWRN